MIIYTITYEEEQTIIRKNGKAVYHLVSTPANDDWIRSTRLLKKRKKDQLQKLMDTPMYYRDKGLLKLIKKHKPK